MALVMRGEFSTGDMGIIAPAVTLHPVFDNQRPVSIPLARQAEPAPTEFSKA